MESHWLTYAKRLQAIASTGLHFSKDEFDRDRYQEIAEIANTRNAPRRLNTERKSAYRNAVVVDLRCRFN